MPPMTGGNARRLVDPCFVSCFAPSPNASEHSPRSGISGFRAYCRRGWVHALSLQYGQQTRPGQGFVAATSINNWFSLLSNMPGKPSLSFSGARITQDSRVQFLTPTLRRQLWSDVEALAAQTQPPGVRHGTDPPNEALESVSKPSEVPRCCTSERRPDLVILQAWWPVLPGTRTSVLSSKRLPLQATDRAALLWMDSGPAGQIFVLRASMDNRACFFALLHRYSMRMDYRTTPGPPSDRFLAAVSLLASSFPCRTFNIANIRVILPSLSQKEDSP
ncbi:hypothetical protein FN846DRAFT_1025491 [Sphaerosporella brunnea]|uniref:Uncharacterized protein n=1 Tax=Sphaerosporella brunnea TaxID=1250544 RepID=A0A5J5EFE8_9PEZI|nr:hypothetical protein FN846DRAFT_1025491 [Sphaerosporella brunnea]